MGKSRKLCPDAIHCIANFCNALQHLFQHVIKAMLVTSFLFRLSMQWTLNLFDEAIASVVEFFKNILYFHTHKVNDAFSSLVFVRHFGGNICLFSCLVWGMQNLRIENYLYDISLVENCAKHGELEKCQKCHPLLKY